MSSYFEEPGSPRTMPPLQPAPFLKDVTNMCPTSYVPPTKVNELNNLSDDEPLIAEIEDVWGLILGDSPTVYPQTRRGRHLCESTKITKGIRNSGLGDSSLLWSTSFSCERGPVATRPRSQLQLLFRYPSICPRPRTRKH